MSLSLIITLISGLIILLIFSIRLIETNTGNYLFSERIRTAGDRKISQFLLAVLRNTDKIKKIIKREFFLIPSRFLKLTHFVWLKMKNRIDRFYDRIRRHK